MSSLAHPHFEYIIKDQIAVVTINRPEKLNALDLSMVEHLLAIANDIETNRSIRMVILTGAGEKAFCAGGDISAWGALSPREFAMSWIRRGHASFDAWARLNCPVIAVLNGHTLGGGLELAAVADMRIAEEHIKIGQPESGIGIIPGWSGTQRTVRRFGAGIVRKMALFGEVFTAQEGLKLGLVDKVCAKGEGLRLAIELGDQVLKRAPIAQEISKMAINTAEGEEVERAIEAMAGGYAAYTSDLSHGVEAFLKKEKAKFEGK